MNSFLWPVWTLMRWIGHPSIRCKMLAAVGALVMGTMLGGFAPEPKVDGQGDRAEPMPLVHAPPIERMERGKVVRVLDGDTLIIEAFGSVLRYQVLGADAPEVLSHARKQAAFSLESKRFLEQLLLGEQVYIQFDPLGKRDRSKRWTAYLFRAPDMLFVNLELVRQGYARHAPQQVSLYTDAFLFYQGRAKELERGVWDPEVPMIEESAFEAQERKQQSDVRDQDPPVLNVNPDKPEKPSTNGTTPVYITKYGKKYHRKDCPHLTKGAKEVDREDLKESMRPCKTCRPDGD